MRDISMRFKAVLYPLEGCFHYQKTCSIAQANIGDFNWQQKKTKNQEDTRNIHYNSFSIFVIFYFFFKSLDDFSFIFQAVSLISIFVQAMTVFSITGIIPVSPGFPKVVTE
jgi:hypothetical protein